MAKKPVKKQTNKRNTTKKTTINNDLNNEVKSIVAIGIAFIIGIFMFTPMGTGAIGAVIKMLCIGLFGIGGYILPIVIFILGGYSFFSKKSVSNRILIFAISTFLLFILLTDAISGKEYIGFSYAYKDSSILDGGAIGRIMADFMIRLIGKVGTIILAILSLVISFILISEKSLAEQIQSLKVTIDQKIRENEERKYAINERKEGEKKSLQEKVEKEFSIEEEIRLKANEDYERRKKEVAEKDIVLKKRPKQINVKSSKPKKSKGGGIFVYDYKNAGKRSNIGSFEAVDYTKPLIIEPHKKELELEEQRRLKEEKQREKERLLAEKQLLEEQLKVEKNMEDTVNTIINSHVDIPVTIDTTDRKEVMKELVKQETLVESLKDELSRQRYLCIETQNELIEQKKTEKSLLKIINAQRETIEKLSNQIKNIEILKAEKKVIEYKNKELIEKVELKEDIMQEINEEIQVEENVDVVTEEVEEVVEIETFEAEKLEETVAEDIESSQPIVSKKPVMEIKDNIDLESEEGHEIIDSYLRSMAENSTPIDELFIKYDNINDTEEKSMNKTKEIESEIEIPKEREVIENINKISQEDLENLRKAEEHSSEQQYKKEILAEKSMPLPKTVEDEYEEKPKEKYVYKYPTVDFLNEKPKNERIFHSKTELLENSKKLETTLKSFGVTAKVIEVNKGPTVTRYEVQPGMGVKVSKIANLADDLALNLAAKGIRIQAPIPGKPAVGIEVPNDKLESVYLREVLDDENFKNFPSKVAFGIGKDIGGNIVVADLAKMPHLLIAGATGSGKSVCINTMITSIIYKSSPEEVKLLMIDPKVVELSVYNGIPHLLIPVVTDPKKASAALHWAVREMEKRYKLFADNNVRDLKGFNQHMIDTGQDGLEPQIIIIIDELADLMMTAAKEVEDAIMRLAAMARAAGIHLIIATQRPSVDVITGVIKSNIPSRLAFAVSSGVDSKTILDSVGAEKLLGKGDMLFSPAGSSEPMRIQGAFISDKEVESIVNFLKTDIDHDYMKEIIEDITSTSNSGKNIANDKVDEILEEVVEFIIERQKASTSLIQRQFRVGFNRAARIVEELENFGVIGQEEGNKPRRVLMTKEEWDRKFKV